MPFRDAGAVVRVIGPAAAGTGKAQRRVLDVLARHTLGRAAAFLYGAARPEELYDPATLADLRSTVAHHDPHALFTICGDLRGPVHPSRQPS